MASTRTHEYAALIEWTGNRGEGTRSYTSYDRAHNIWSPNRPPISGSSDPAFRGDESRYNPEILLVASLASCHMLWFLHLAAEAGIIVTGYTDDSTGTMVETPGGGGHFTGVTLRPAVTVREGADPHVVERLHERAHDLCFIAQSVNFPVPCDARMQVDADSGGRS